MRRSALWKEGLDVVEVVLGLVDGLGGKPGDGDLEGAGLRRREGLRRLDGRAALFL